MLQNFNCKVIPSIFQLPSCSLQKMHFCVPEKLFLFADGPVAGLAGAAAGLDGAAAGLPGGAGLLGGGPGRGGFGF